MTDLWNKLNDLERRCKLGLGITAFFKRKIGELGEEKANAILKAMKDRPFHIVQSKSVEWEGLTLSRQPTDVEKIAVKGISSAQESGKEQVTKVLLDARARLIKDAVRELETMEPANYHALVLTPPKSARKALRERLAEVYARGRELVGAELDAQRPSKAQEKIFGFPVVTDSTIPEGVAALVGNGRTYSAVSVSGLESKQEDIDDELLDSLSDLTLSRLANSIQSRAIEIIASLVTLGMVGSALIDRVKEMMAEVSERPEELTASGIANRVLSEGRKDEMVERADDISRFEISCILDNNLCDECAPHDGETATSMDALPSTPIDTCLGMSLCRCFTIAIWEESKQVSIRVKNVQNLSEESVVEITVRKN